MGLKRSYLEKMFPSLELKIKTRSYYKLITIMDNIIDLVSSSSSFSVIMEGKFELTSLPSSSSSSSFSSVIANEEKKRINH